MKSDIISEDQHMKTFFFLAGILWCHIGWCQDDTNRLPIIDMHLHALPGNFFGPGPLAFCLPTNQWPTKEHGIPYRQTFKRWEKDPTTVDSTCLNPIWSSTDSDTIMVKTLEILERRNIIGITSGPLVHRHFEMNPQRIIKGLMFNLAFNAPPIDSLRRWFVKGDYQILGEVTNQYSGIAPGDPDFEPYLALAEELDIPVGIHMGPGPPGVAYVNSPGYRGRLHDPLLLEETLLKYPDLRIYICHAGWPMIDNLLALLWTHPQVYVDLGIISYALPVREFHHFLRRIVEAGFGNRIMFGSDQMVWPETIGVAISNIESADFLTQDQKRDIFYNNAARFLQFSREEIEGHHSW